MLQGIYLYAFSIKNDSSSKYEALRGMFGTEK